MAIQLYLLISTIILESATANSEIRSETRSRWGAWGPMDTCGDGWFAAGFQLKVDSTTGINSVRIFCGNPEDKKVTSPTSLEGKWGTWRKKLSCQMGALTGFQLRVETTKKETVTENIRFICTRMPRYEREDIEGDGGNIGGWRMQQQCPKGQAICGIKTQVEENSDELDKKGLSEFQKLIIN